MSDPGGPRIEVAVLAYAQQANLLRCTPLDADVPGSLKNYHRRRAAPGGTGRTARCVLLDTPEDVERQFGLSARSRLARGQIHVSPKALRRLDRKKRASGDVIATAGEILGEDEDAAFEGDRTTDDTRVRTAPSWLGRRNCSPGGEPRAGLPLVSTGELLGRGPATCWPASLLRAAIGGSLEAIAEKLIDADPARASRLTRMMAADSVRRRSIARCTTWNGSASPAKIPR